LCESARVEKRREGWEAKISRAPEKEWEIRRGMKGKSKKERKKAHRELVYIKPIRTKPNKRKKEKESIAEE